MRLSYFKSFNESSSNDDFEQIYGVSLNDLTDTFLEVEDEGFKVTTSSVFRSLKWEYFKEKPTHIDDFYRIFKISVSNSDIRQVNIGDVGGGSVYYDDPDILKMMFDFYRLVESLFSNSDVKVVYNLNYNQSNLMEIILIKREKEEIKNISSEKFKHSVIDGNGLSDIFDWKSRPVELMSYGHDVFNGSIDLKFMSGYGYQTNYFDDAKSRYVAQSKKGDPTNLIDIFYIIEFISDFIKKNFSNVKISNKFNENIIINQQNIIDHFTKDPNSDMKINFTIDGDEFAFYIELGDSKKYKIVEELGKVLGISRTKSHIVEIIKEIFVYFKKF